MNKNVKQLAQQCAGDTTDKGNGNFPLTLKETFFSLLFGALGGLLLKFFCFLCGL